MQLVKFFIIFKLHYTQKKVMFKTVYIKKFNKLLKILISFGLVKKTRVKKNFIFLTFNRSKKKFFLTSLKLIYKTNSKKNVSLKTLNKLEATTLNSTYLLLTHKGLLTTVEARQAHTGGFIFCRLT